MRTPSLNASSATIRRHTKQPSAPPLPPGSQPPFTYLGRTSQRLCTVVLCLRCYATSATGSRAHDPVALLPPPPVLPPPPGPPTLCFSSAVCVRSRRALCRCATSAVATGLTTLPTPLPPPPALPPPQGPPSPSPIMVSMAIFFSPLSRCVSHHLKSHAATATAAPRRSRYCPATTVQCLLQTSPPAASSFPHTTCARLRLTRSRACCLRRLRGSRCQRPSLVPHAQALESCSTTCLLGSPSGASEIYFGAFREKSFAVVPSPSVAQQLLS